MAQSSSNLPSPRLSPAHGLSHPFDHATPAHSTHNSQHSLRSSTSSRTPLHSLSLHDYRKLQNSPASLSATPPGRTLRRKAAASALKEVERVPSVKRTSAAAAASFQTRLLHSSQSAYQLSDHQPLPPSPPLLDEDAELLDTSSRSRSAEPRLLGQATTAGYSSLRTSTSSKVSNWKPIKKLPKPAPPPLPLGNTQRVGIPIPAFHTTPASSAENVSGSHSTPSSFSLSRFPPAPTPIGIPTHPSNDENVRLRLKTSFAGIAPATPPATPAVIHYRGASFDLINPHDSLLYHDIETPSRDLDSTDYSPVRSSGEPLLLQLDMAPRRALYTDLTSAYSSIRRREDAPYTPEVEVPSQPAPAYLSPESSTYSSPDHPYNTNPGISPLTVKKRDHADSRFSLTEMTPIKKLTQAITKRMAKVSESEQGPNEQELEEFSPATPAEANFDGEYPRPLTRSYSNIPSPTSRSYRKGATEVPFLDSPISETHEELPALASMIPDDPSSQLGRGEGHQSSTSTGNRVSKGYYDEVASLYPSSSVYTGDAEGGNPPSVYSKRASAAFGAYDLGDESMSNPFRQESTYLSTNPEQASYRRSNPLTQEYPGASYFEHNEKTDTISKFIDQYEAPEAMGFPRNASKGDVRSLRSTQEPSGLTHFDFELQQQPTSSVSPSESSLSRHLQGHARARKPKVTQVPGSPPHRVAPLEPAFEYDEIPDIFNRPSDSDALSPVSSYGDTRNLLQLSQGEPSYGALGSASPALLEPSSSYSQPSHRTTSHTLSSTPQEALDQAEQIFQEAGSNQSIPAIWSRRGSGNLFRSRQSTVIEGNEGEAGDWETVGNKSAISEGDDDSIADYSSTSEERRASRFSGGMEGGAPYAVSPPAHQRSRHVYHHPSPLPTHGHPFSSSPPPLDTRASVRSTPQGNRVTFGLSLPRNVATVPAFHTAERAQNEEPYFFMPDPAPWTREEPSPYALSDKETQELLNSGPNEEIVYEDAPGRVNRHYTIKDAHRQDDSSEDVRNSELSSEPRVLKLSPLHEKYNSVVLGRENSFEKITQLGPKGNLTGTPLGTGMKEVGSSIADNSSPGARWGSSVSSNRSTGPGFYTDPNAVASKTVIRPFPISTSRSRIGDYERSPSQETLSPPQARLNLFPSVPEQPSPAPKERRSSKSLAYDGRSHRHGRSAVHGQTRLREMVLAPRTASSAHSHSTHFSDLMRADQNSIRASSAHTNAPLRPPGTADTFHPSTSAASVLTPHLRTPARDPTPEDEEERRKLSWTIFGVFCLLPPLLMLYRWLGDSVVMWVSRGRFDSACVTPKRVALHAGAPLNILIVIAILVPIIVVNV